MVQYLITIDLDGTTLNNQSQLTDFTIQTLRKVSELGHIIMIATGRPSRNSQHFYDQIGIKSPMVNLNGAYAHFPGNPDWEGAYVVELDKQIVFDLMDDEEPLGVDLVCVEGPGYIMASSKDLPEGEFFQMKGKDVTLITPETLNFNPASMSIFSDTSKQESIKRAILKEYGEFVDVDIWGGSQPFLEVVKRGVHKAYAIDRIAKHYHIPQEHIIAFGDQHNDLTMISYAGHGVAVANAIPELKAIAQDITTYSNDEDGLAKYLIEFFNLD